jgi:hypothetical protein
VIYSWIIIRLFGERIAIFLEQNAAQQTLATATEQAIKNEFPYFQLITSTPN